MMHRAALAFLLAGTGLVATPVAQRGGDKDDEEIAKAGPVDPYTERDPERMKAAGIVSYGPFPWADGHTTDDIETELGKGRFLWLETAHFRIGFNLKSIGWPEEQDEKAFLRDEIEAVRKRLPKFPKKPKTLTPWVRLHLYAFRLEQLYADVQALLSVTDDDFADGAAPPNGRYLGMQDKYLVLLLQKRSDVARYFEHFCDFQCDSSMQWYHPKTHQMLTAVAAQALEGFDASAVHGHVLYSVTHNLMSGYRGYHLRLPLWLEEGLAHWYSRRVPNDGVNVQILDSEAVAQDDKQADWAVKVRRRAQHEGVCYPFEEMVKWTTFEQMGYHAHSQSWSRVDYLMQLDRAKVGQLITRLKQMPPVLETQVPPEKVGIAAQKLLFELFELDAPAFDERWREWVLKTYPKK
jgi:hypothetical protein